MGILLRSIAALPLTSRTPNFWNSCLMATSSSFPELLAWALAILLTWSSAFLCHPPKVSTEMGMKEMPSLSHAWRDWEHFLLKAKVRRVPRCVS